MHHKYNRLFWTTLANPVSGTYVDGFPLKNKCFKQAKGNGPAEDTNINIMTMIFLHFSDAGGCKLAAGVC